MGRGSEEDPSSILGGETQDSIKFILFSIAERETTGGPIELTHS